MGKACESSHGQPLHANPLFPPESTTFDGHIHTHYSRFSAMFHDCWQHWIYYRGFLVSSYDGLSDSKVGGRIVSLTLTTPPPGPPTVVFIDLKPFATLLWSFLCKFRAFCTNGTPTRSEFVSHIFGRLLVLHLRQLQERYHHHLGHPFSTQQQIVYLSRLRRGPCGLCLLPPPYFEIAFPKIAIMTISVPLLGSSISVCNLISLRRTSTKLSWESVIGW